MNAVDRFSNTLARYRQQSTLPPVLPVQSVQPQPVQQPARPSDVERAMNKVAEVTPILSRLAALVTRVQNPAPAATAPASYPASYPTTYPSPYPAPYPGTPPYVAPTGAVGQSLQRLGQAVGSRDVDTFVRQAAPVLDEALPLIDDIVNLVGGKSRQPAQVGIASTQAPSGSVSSLGQQVAPVMDGVTSLVTGVGSLVKAFEGLFKR
ncbi:hypothetical protein D3C87_761200 [compost metagenome]